MEFFTVAVPAYIPTDSLLRFNMLLKRQKCDPVMSAMKKKYHVLWECLIEKFSLTCCLFL